MDKKFEIFLVIVVVGIIIWAIYQIIGILEALIPLAIVLGVALVILIFLAKQGILKAPEILKDLSKKKKK